MDYWAFELQQWVMTPDGRAIVTQKIEKDLDHPYNRYFVEIPKLNSVSRVYNESILVACGAPRKIIKNKLERLKEIMLGDTVVRDAIDDILKVL